MDQERFEALVAAYGADPDRWPEAERTEALAFMDRDRTAAERLLFEARMIDAVLAAAPGQSPNPAFIDRVLASAPRPAPERAGAFAGWREALFGRRVWLAGAGLAATCVLGALVGAAAMSTAAADLGVDEVLGATLADEEYGL